MNQEDTTSLNFNEGLVIQKPILEKSKSVSYPSRYMTTKSTSTEKRKMNSITSGKKQYSKFFSANFDVDFPQLKAKSRRSAKFEFESFEPVFEVDGEAEAKDERKSVRTRLEVISDGEDSMIHKRQRRLRIPKFTIKRSRSTDLRLPKVPESNEENYAELKKKILFEHHINTVVDKSEEMIVDKNMFSLLPGKNLHKDLDIHIFRAIVEDPDEDIEIKKRGFLSCSISSRRSSRRSSLINSPMSRSLKRIIIDEIPSHHDENKIHNLTSQAPDKIEERSSEEDEEESGRPLTEEWTRRRKNIKAIIEGDYIAGQDKSILATINRTRSDIFLSEDVIEETDENK